MVLSLRTLLHGAVATYFVVRNLRRHRHHQQTPSLRGAEICNIALPLRWEARNGELMVHDQVFHLKGVNWYGSETEEAAVQGLDKRTMDDIFFFLQAQKFNALRLPFSLKFSLDYNSPVPKSERFLDKDLHGLTKGQLFSRIVEKAAEHQMIVLLDMHRLNDAFIPQARKTEGREDRDGCVCVCVCGQGRMGHSDSPPSFPQKPTELLSPSPSPFAPSPPTLPFHHSSGTTKTTPWRTCFVGGM